VLKGTPRGLIFRFSNEVMCGYSLFTPGAQGTSPLWCYFCFSHVSLISDFCFFILTLSVGCRHLIPQTYRHFWVYSRSPDVLSGLGVFSAVDGQFSLLFSSCQWFLSVFSHASAMDWPCSIITCILGFLSCI
jgi:hypothetical protein